MFNPIKYSINHDFWIQFQENFISFSFAALQSDIHFTIAFNDKTPDINFHITRNVENKSDKPQIKIVITEKKTLQDIQENLDLFTRNLLHRILLPIDFQKLKLEHDSSLWFIPFDSLENSSFKGMVEKELLSRFKQVNASKKKIRTEPNFDAMLENFSSLENQELLSEFITDLPDKYEKDIEGGILLSNNFALTTIRVRDKWFTVRKDLQLFDFLCAFIKPNLAKRIIWKAKRGLISIKSAKSYSDTKSLNKPIRLVFRSSKRQ